MRTWAWRVTVAASSLLLIATAAGWARAQWARDVTFYRWAAGPDEALRLPQAGVVASRGSLAFHLNTIRFAPLDPAAAAELRRDAARMAAWTTVHDPPESFDPAFVPGAAARGGWAAGGFAWQTAAYAGGPGRTVRPFGFASAHPLVEHAMRRVAIPWWSLTLGFACAPARALYAWRTRRRRHRRPPHACPACGYDLRATSDPAGPRLSACPECGRAAPSA